MTTTAGMAGGHVVLGVVLAAQGLRGVGYGLAAVQLGAILRGQGLDARGVGLVLAAIVAGSAAASLALGRFGDRLGRTRAYGLLYAALAVAGVVLALGGPAWLPGLVALSGALSVEVVESGPFTTLEQVFLASTHAPQAQITRGFGLYNAVATLAGAAGALLGTLPAGPRLVGGTLIMVGVAGALLATRLPPGVVFAAIGVLQAASFLAAPLLAARVGLLATMVFTHLPSNLLLAAIPFASTLPVAIALLLARTCLSQMDVPTRQAYVMVGEGGLDVEADDQRLLEKGSFVYDALYAWCQRHTDQPASA